MYTRSAYVRVGQNSYKVALILDATIDASAYYIHDIVTGEREWVAREAIRDNLPPFSVLANTELLELDIDISDFQCETKSGLRIVS